jgi:hypothetical protein
MRFRLYELAEWLKRKATNFSDWTLQGRCEYCHQQLVLYRNGKWECSGLRESIQAEMGGRVAEAIISHKSQARAFQRAQRQGRRPRSA